MRRPRLPDGMRDDRPEALDLLGRVVRTVRRRRNAEARAERDLLARDALFCEAVEMDPPIRWADLARAADCNPVTVIDAVKRAKRREAANGG